MHLDEWEISEMDTYGDSERILKVS